MTASSTTAILIGAGNSIVADFSVPDSSAKFSIVWTDSATPIEITDVLIDGVTLIGVDASRVINQIDESMMTETFRRDNAIIGSVSHVGGIISNIVNSKITPHESHAQFIDFLAGVGVVNLAGLAITPSVTGLAVASGFVMSPGAGTEQGNRSENTLVVSAQPVALVAEFVGITNTIINASTAVIDTTVYDDGTAVPATIPGVGNAVIKYLFMFPTDPAVTGRNIFIMHGQTVYTNLQDAIDNADVDLSTINTPSLFANRSLLLARWAVEDGADLTNPAEAVLLPGALFGTRIGAGGGAGGGGGGDVFGSGASVVNELFTAGNVSGDLLSVASNVVLLDGAFTTIGSDLKIESNTFPAGVPLTYPVGRP